MRTIHAIYENGVFRPTDPVEFPEKCEVEIAVLSHASGTKRTTLSRLAELARKFEENPDLPEDLAAQHDHYLYGTPRT